MLIEKIKISNFGPFYKSHELVFPGDGSGLHVLRGDTGQGKTSLHRAILWGLYGKVRDRKGQEIRSTSLANRTAVREDIYEFSVGIQFSHDGMTHVLTRRTSAKSHTDHAYDSGMRPFLVRDGEPVQNPEHEIRRILPEEVSRFFFFDGEMLRDYEELLDQTSRSMSLLRNSIELVLGIPYLRIARDDLLAVKRGYESERARIVRHIEGGSYEQLVNSFELVSNHIREREQEIGELERQMHVLDVDVADLKRTAATLAPIKVLAEQRIAFDQQVSALEQSKARAAEDLSATVGGLYRTVLYLSAESILKTLRDKHAKALERYDRKQRLVGQQEFIQRTISAVKCRLCGTVLDKEKLRALTADLRQVQAEIKAVTEVPEPNLEFDELANRLEAIGASVVRSKTLQDLEGRITNFDRELATAHAKLDTVVEKLSGVDEDEPRRIQGEISAKSEELGRLRGLKESAEASLLEDRQDKSDLDNEIKSIDQAELGVLGKRIDTVTPLAEVFERAISVYREDRREYVGRVASEIFRELRWKKDFTGLEINQQFGLNVVLSKGGVVLDRAEWRSSGEEQVVALSLIGALNKCAQVRAPVFMDTPFGRLDIKHGKRILGFLPKLAEQVVIFVTDREFTPADEAAIAPMIRSDHSVIHGGEEKGSAFVVTRTAHEVSS